MGFNLQTYQNQYAFTFESETLGPIRIWAANTHKATKAFRYHLPRSKDSSLRDFMLFFLSITAALENPENPRCREEPLTQEQLSGVSDEELETIAAEILKHHKYLFEGQNLARNDQEGNVGYLRRVVDGYCKVQHEAMIKGIDQMTAGFSKALIPDLSALTQLNSSIANSLDSVRRSQASLVLRPVSDPQHKTNALLNEVVNIVSRQNEASERTVSTIGQLAQLGESWQQSALESSNTAARQVRITNILAVIMTVLTILAVILTYLSYKAATLPH